MIKSDFSEVKKMLKRKNGNLQTIWATYVNSEKTVLFSSKKEVFDLSEEEQDVYGKIFSKVLSGKQDLNSFVIPMDNDEKKENLFEAVKSSDDSIVQSLIDNVVETYEASENFAVLVTTGNASVQQYASDGAKLEDETELYRFMICVVCPTKQEKPNVVYRHEHDFFEKAKRDYVLQVPTVGFLYPAFENREANANKMLYYIKSNKKGEDYHVELLEEVLKTELPTPSEKQEEVYHEILEESLGREKNVEDLYKIELELEKKKSDILLDDDGSGESSMDYRDINDVLAVVGGKTLESPLEQDISVNVVGSDKFKIAKGKEIVVTANSEGMVQIKQQEIDGRQCLVIPLDDMTFNGIRLN